MRLPRFVYLRGVALSGRAEGACSPREALPRCLVLRKLGSMNLLAADSSVLPTSSTRQTSRELRDDGPEATMWHAETRGDGVMDIPDIQYVRNGGVASGHDDFDA